MRQTVDWSSEYDCSNVVDTVILLAGNCGRKTLRPAVKLVKPRRRPVRRVVVMNTTQLANCGADHDVRTVHTVHITGKAFASTPPTHTTLFYVVKYFVASTVKDVFEKVEYIIHFIKETHFYNLLKFLLHTFL